MPQGSQLGPLLFVLYINDTFKQINRCEIHLFAHGKFKFNCSYVINNKSKLFCGNTLENVSEIKNLEVTSNLDKLKIDCVYNANG